MTDHFAALELPRRYALDPADLDRRRRELARRFHPDRFARAAPAERRAALERAAAVNDAHRVLADPLRRAEHLLALAGVAPPRTVRDPELLEAQLEARERLARARAEGDAAAIARVAEAARAAAAGDEAELARVLGAGGEDSAALGAAAALVARARFHAALAAEAAAQR